VNVADFDISVIFFTRTDRFGRFSFCSRYFVELWHAYIGWLQESSDWKLWHGACVFSWTV